jgi:hypothetical protein
MMKTSGHRKPGTDHCVPRRCDPSPGNVLPIAAWTQRSVPGLPRGARLIGLSLLLAAASAQAPDTAAILQSARTAALTYSKSLPNFTCTESISRFDDWSDRGAWTPVDKLTVEVSYSGEREDYRLVARDGKPTDQTLEAVSGSLTKGEFASALLLIFHPSSEAEFHWRRWEKLRGRRLAEFTYRVSLEKSRYLLKQGGKSAIVGYHGVIDILPETGAVYRWSVESEPPREFPILQSTTSLEYDYRKIEGAPYLLPVRAEMRSTERGMNFAEAQRLPVRARAAAQRPMHHRNLVEFENYRKFGVDSTITFK